jgi:hypothetical protein
VLPRRELERAVRDDVRRLGPLGAELLDRLLVDGEERVVRRLLDEPRLRARQLHLERVVVERLDADLVGERLALRLAALARVVLLRTLDAVELVRVVGGELGRERPLPRVLEVVRRDRVAVRPLAVLAQVVRDGRSVLVPARREARLGLERLLVQLHERVHDVQQHVRRRRVRREPRIERGRLGAPVDRERLVGGETAACLTGRRVRARGLVVVVVAAATCGDEAQCSHHHGDRPEPGLSPLHTVVPFFLDVSAASPPDHPHRPSMVPFQT